MGDCFTVCWHRVFLIFDSPCLRASVEQFLKLGKTARLGSANKVSRGDDTIL